MGGPHQTYLVCETAMKSCVHALAFVAVAFAAPMTIPEEDFDYDVAFETDEPAVAEFIQDTTKAQHHKGADQACACCHHFRPAAECYSMRCGDHSGNYCWSATDKGIHWGWGAGGRHWKQVLPSAMTTRKTAHARQPASRKSRAIFSANHKLVSTRVATTSYQEATHLPCLKKHWTKQASSIRGVSPSPLSNGSGCGSPLRMG